MNTSRNSLLVIGTVSVLLLGCSHAPTRADLFAHPGNQWLSWSGQEREDFVYGFIVGYGHGASTACSAANDLFEKGKPHIIGHDSVPSTFPSARCNGTVPSYSNVKVDLAKGPNFTAYTSTITDFYTKHPEYRDMPLTEVMGSLAGPTVPTAEELYSRIVAPPRH